MRKLLFIMGMFLLVGVANTLAIEWVAVEDPNTPGIAYWSDPTNWNEGVLPAAGVKTTFGGNVQRPAALIDTVDAISGQTVLGDNGGNTLSHSVIVADGGVWNATGTAWTAAGYNREGHITVERGGALYSEHRIGVGLVGSANPSEASTLDVNGGSVDINGNLQIGTAGSHLGIVTVQSGVLESNAWEFRDTGGTWSFLDVHHGTVIVNQDVTGAIPDLIASGALTGFGGAGTVNYAFANGQTTITANDPLNRTPAMDAVVPAGPVTLSWDNVIPSPAGVAVYFGTDLESLTRVADPNTSGALTSVVVSAPVFDEYIWRLDTYGSLPGVDPNDPIVGDTMYFVASDDSAPSLTMLTPPTATWIGEPVTVEVEVNDDSKSDVTITWSTDVADPNETWTDQVTVLPAGTVYPTTVSATIALDYHAAQFTVTATATDANPLGAVGEASVGLDCAETACQATRAPLGEAANYPADIVADCMHDLADFAVMAADWLNDYTITSPQPLP